MPPGTAPWSRGLWLAAPQGCFRLNMLAYLACIAQQASQGCLLHIAGCPCRAGRLLCSPLAGPCCHLLCSQVSEALKRLTEAGDKAAEAGGGALPLALLRRLLLAGAVRRAMELVEDTGGCWQRLWRWWLWLLRFWSVRAVSAAHSRCSQEQAVASMPE